MDTADVGSAERAVLGQNDDLLTGQIADERARGGDVLVRLAPGAERIPVEIVQAVHRGRTSDIEHLVLPSDGRDLQCNRRVDIAAENRDTLADQIFRIRDCGGRTVCIIVDDEVELVSVDFSGTTGHVIDTSIEAS